jgi:hypothetical protein
LHILDLLIDSTIIESPPYALRPSNMARTRNTRNPRTTSPQEEAQATSESQPAEKPLTKADAARAALSAGLESPLQAVAYIKDRFGIDMDPQHFSAVKSTLKKKEGRPPGKPGRKPKSAGVEGYLAPPRRQPPVGGGDLIDSLEALKPLIAQYGSAKVKRLVDLLG